MSDGRAFVDFVTGSSVRSDVLRAIAGGDREIERLLAELDASESAIYGAVSELDDRGYVAERDAGYVLTGSGRLLTDVIRSLDATDALLGGDPEYWRTHGIDVLPARFRRELPVLADCEIVRATETDPRRVVRAVADRLEAAEHASIASPIYQDEYAKQLSSVGDVRLLLDAAVVEDAVEGSLEPPPGVDVRLTEIGFALSVTDSCVMLSLPDLDGQYDARSEVVAENEAALDWGRRLFEHCWNGATPAEAFELPD